MDDKGKLLLRLTIGGLLILHGIKKIDTGTGWIETMLTAKGLPTFLAYGVYVGEVLAPALLIVGLVTRLAALVVAGNMAFAVYLAHWEQLGRLSDWGGWQVELPALFLFGALCIVLLGPGSVSLDGRRRRA